MLELGLPHRCSPVAAVLTVSIGVGTAEPDSFASVAEFMAATDRALYAAKRRGRNCVVTLETLDDEQELSDSAPESKIEAAQSGA